MLSFGAGVQARLQRRSSDFKVYVDRPDYKGWAMSRQKHPSGQDKRQLHCRYGL